MEPKTIAITRPVGKGSDTAELVKNLGWIPFIFHTVELKPLDEQNILGQIQSSLIQGQPDWIVFMSSTGVKLLFDVLTSHPSVPRFPRETRLLAVGPRTRETLLRYGITEALVPKNYTSAGVGEWFGQLDPKHLRIVLVRSSSADDSLANSLTAKGAIVRTINIYDSAMPTDLQSVFDFLDGLRLGRFAAVLFTSAISVSNLFTIAETRFEGTGLIHRLNRILVGAVGPVTAERLRNRGVETNVPDEYLIEKAVAKLISQRIQLQES
ncbi:MAG TPA: uroporphyrinogen-III synthase [Candidatus Bathyarchaeia archaeon]